MPYIVSQLQHISRLDLVWDEYFTHSLKADTCNKRVCRRVMPFLEIGRILHLEDAVKEGYTKASLCTVDTDVLVLAVSAAQHISIIEL